uniref:Uncharacterized protein n=1 Tax=Chromera velia CCMP2878 TaxID=1169474 RepID=A0A0G4I2H1_9ALVE|eukprot:Cvel_10411.t1-p1 / transcript=Cvel_10411.t1 / gene=Cvel_10411 / organism=Chromera_velia_CCMP2878 / gene_product=Protein-lysine methyltransferase METTL21D, putative / transcript_product=Protein-lysine methyltransferase METTL21D, putative / location=Cvel_scaffold627:53583-57620(+) / protein_length=946 / sequence_SO=supercontig / SO=protein_coding / is_pseudo=false
MRAESEKEIAAICLRRVSSFSLINCSTALSRLAKLGASQKKPPESVLRRVNQILSESLKKKQKDEKENEGDKVQLRQLGSILWACAKLKMSSEDRFSAIRSHALFILEGRTDASFGSGGSKQSTPVQPQEISNLLWACARLELKDPPLLRVLDQAAAEFAAQMTSQGLSNCLWSYGQMQRGGLSCVTKVEKQNISMETFNPQETASSLWASARIAVALERSDEGEGEKDNAEDASTPLPSKSSLKKVANRLIDHAVGLLRRSANRFSVQQLANVLWAIAKLSEAFRGEIPPEALSLSRTSAAELGSRLDSDPKAAAPAELSMAAWACGSLGIPSLLLRPPMRRVVSLLRGGELGGQGVANLVWGLAKAVEANRAERLGELSEKNVEVAVGIAERLMEFVAPLCRENAVTPPDLSQISWGLARLSALLDCSQLGRAAHSLAAGAASLLRAAEEEKASEGKSQRHTPSGSSPSTWTSGQLSTVCVSLAKLGVQVWEHGGEGEEVLEETDRQGAEGEEEEEETDDLREATRVLARVCRRRARRGQLASRDLSGIVWAFAEMGPRGGRPRLLRSLSSAAVAQREDFNAQELLKFVGAFERAGGSDERLSALLAEDRLFSPQLPGLPSLKLTARAPGRRFEGTGVALWDAAFVLAEWIARVCLGGGGGQTNVVPEAVESGEKKKRRKTISDEQEENGKVHGKEDSLLRKPSESLSRLLSFPSVAGLFDSSGTNDEKKGKEGKGKKRSREGDGESVKKKEKKNVSCVEIGAGLGLPSFACAMLGMKVIATDGDKDVIELLEKNIEANSEILTSAGGSVRSAYLLWGDTAQAQEAAEIIDSEDRNTQEILTYPDLVLAADVVYGNQEGVWKQLSDTLRDVCGPETLLLLANVQRFPRGDPRGEWKFYEMLQAHFHSVEIPHASLHAETAGQKNRSGSCMVSALCKRNSRDVFQ